jgi:photosystem II stability/assembly factor-like uncharacterized protein
MHAQVNAVDFVSRDVGWVVSATTSGGHLFHTTDAGETWIDQADTVSEPTPLFFSVAALDPARAIAVGSENGFLHPDDFHRGPPAIVVTDDGGGSWRRAPIQGLDVSRVQEIELLDVCVTSTGIGLAVGTDVTTFSETIVLLTRDSGASWSDVTTELPAIPLAKVSCVGEQDLWFAGGTAQLTHSSDGGQTWHDASESLPADFRIGAISFADGLDGWLVGDRLRALHTVDGGGHWTVHEVPGTTGLVELTLGVDFDRQDGVIVAQDLHPLSIGRSSIGVTFATRDGGATWVETVLPEGINAIWDVELIR